LNVIAALILAAAVVGQPPAQKAPRKVQAQGLSKSEAQAQSVVDVRRARKAAASKRQAAQNVRAAAQNQADQLAYEQAYKAQQEHEIKMGPIWAAEHANQIQQQRNALIAQRNAIENKKAEYDAWILWQLRNSR
jgi:hypothetical protein